MNRGEMLRTRAEKCYTPNYLPAPIDFVRGEGVWLWDSDGKRYLDMLSGIAVSALGHGDQALGRALTEQIDTGILHLSNLFANEPAVKLAEALVSDTFAEKVYFCNSGAEANECAIKLARRFHHDRGQPRDEIICFERSFHGRTYGALAATAQPKYQEGFGPMLAGFRYLPYGDEKALEAAISPKTAAVMLEPIQGEGGVRVAPAGYLAACRALTEAAGALLIYDEVQVGVGRTGYPMAHEHDSVPPDILSLAKGIGGGLPLGATLTTARVGASLAVGTHATTFGGNPLVCRAGLEVWKRIRTPGFLSQVAETGRKLSAGLETLGRTLEVFSDVRGRGLIVGAELRENVGFTATDLALDLREEGVLAHIAGASVLRLVPPLIISAAEIDAFLAVLERIVSRRRST